MPIEIGDRPEENLLAFARQWADLLGQGKLLEACALLDGPDEYGGLWTPERLQNELNETYSPETIFYREHPEGPFFTSPFDAPSGRERFHCDAFDDGNGYWVDYDLPISGEFSDLTALFNFRASGRLYRVALEDLHVM